MLLSVQISSGLHQTEINLNKPPSFSWFILTEYFCPQTKQRASELQDSRRHAGLLTQNPTRILVQSQNQNQPMLRHAGPEPNPLRPDRTSGTTQRIIYQTAVQSRFLVLMNCLNSSKWSFKHLIWPRDTSDHAHAAAPHLWPWVAMSMARRTGTGDPPSVTVRTSMDFLSGRRLPWRLSMGESTRFLGGSAETGREGQQFRTQRLKVTVCTSLSRLGQVYRRCKHVIRDFSLISSAHLQLL